MTARRSSLLSLALAAGMAHAACGTAEVDELEEAQRRCSFDSTSCHCSGNDYVVGATKACSAASMKGRCCDRGVADFGGCSCYSLGCALDGGGGTCRCGVQGGSMTECPPPSGVCCLSAIAQECRCYSAFSACPGAEQPVQRCTIGQITCELLDGGVGTKSCSAIEIVDEEIH